MAKSDLYNTKKKKQIHSFSNFLLRFLAHYGTTITITATNTKHGIFSRANNIFKETGMRKKTSQKDKIQNIAFFLGQQMSFLSL